MTHRITLLLEYTKPEEVEKRMESEETDDENDTKTWHPSEVRAVIAKEAEAE